MTDSMTTRTIRIPTALVDRAEAKATDLDRSVSWLIRQALTCYLDGLATPAVQWPDDWSGGATTFQATVRWRMPNFATGEPESDTTMVIDRAMTAVCDVLRSFGAQDEIAVDGPISVMPMPLNRSVNSTAP